MSNFFCNSSSSATSLGKSLAVNASEDLLSDSSAWNEYEIIFLYQKNLNEIK